MQSLSKSELSTVSLGTIRHYEENANSFWEGTRDHDVSQNYGAFLAALPQEKGLKILDLGCGPGRDLKYFKDEGHDPVGLDGCSKFCEMARAYAGCEVLQQDFLKLELQPESFHGIFANASLFHVPGQTLERVLQELHHALKPQGILFSSNPRGTGEGWTGDRYGNYMEYETYYPHLMEAGFKVVDHYYRPKGLPRPQQPWLAVVAKKR
jgi:SAM-dependent methyltransferase